MKHTIQLPANSSLSVHREALVQPKITPGGVGDEVPKPAVADLVYNDISKRAIAGQQTGRDKGQAGVLHPTEREGWRHEQHIISRQIQQIKTHIYCNIVYLIKALFRLYKATLDLSECDVFL